MSEGGTHGAGLTETPFSIPFPMLEKERLMQSVSVSVQLAMVSFISVRLPAVSFISGATLRKVFPRRGC